MCGSYVVRVSEVCRFLVRVIVRVYMFFGFWVLIVVLGERVGFIFYLVFCRNWVVFIKFLRSVDSDFEGLFLGEFYSEF